jgi:hypothetical protein
MSDPATRKTDPAAADCAAALSPFLEEARAPLEGAEAALTTLARASDEVLVWFGEDPARCTPDDRAALLPTLLEFAAELAEAHAENAAAAAAAGGAADEGEAVVKQLGGRGRRLLGAALG